MSKKCSLIAMQLDRLMETLLGMADRKFECNKLGLSDGETLREANRDLLGLADWGLQGWLLPQGHSGDIVIFLQA